MNDNFDYDQSAELYSGQTSLRKRAARYMRFPSAAEAIKYAVESLPRSQLRHTSLETGDERVEGDGILQLYMAAGYPLPRGA